MQRYDLSEWIHWSEREIREYAAEIAVDHGADAAETKWLTRKMLERAVRDSIPEPADYPRKLTEDEIDAEYRENYFRAFGQQFSKKDLFDKNYKINKPYNPDSFYKNYETRIVGRGLTRKNFLKVSKESKSSKKFSLYIRKRFSKNPFRNIVIRTNQISEEALWIANCYPLSSLDWIVLDSAKAPFEGLAWYAIELGRAISNATTQAELGKTKFAMWHAFNAGVLQSELEQRLANGPLFEKYQATSMAQRDGGRSRKRIPDAQRIEAYWRYRSAGEKRIEAGRRAAEELGLSEASIRNAFPGSRYPE